MNHTDDLVKLKLINGAYLLNVFSDTLDNAKNQIKSKLESDTLLKDITLNSISAPNLSKLEQKQLANFITQDIGIKYEQKALELDAKSSGTKTRARKKAASENGQSTENLDFKVEKSQLSKKYSHTTKKLDLDKNEYETRIIKSNLRSGTTIKYDGNIVVIGDVNAGAELTAKGSIIVLGTLRGLAMAGSDGDKDSLIIAHSIKAAQLRIASAIAIPPAFENRSGSQMAFIADKQSDAIEIQHLD